MSQEHNNKCVTCGAPIPMASINTPVICDQCGGFVCNRCVSRMEMHYNEQAPIKGFVRLCEKCANEANKRGNKEINPFKYIG